MRGKGLTVVVYCASSREVDEVYLDAAKRLGQLFAENGVTCVNGAGNQGLMGALNDSILHHGGTVKGVIPRFMADAGWCHERLSETIITETIHERKECMANLSDAAIALPGGLGTLEELSEILTWKQLGLYTHPVIILNVNGYYDTLLQFFDQMIAEKFMNGGFRAMWEVAFTSEEAMGLLRNPSEWSGNVSKYGD
ncbi:MAG: TIGR00730 family Rossman fold protein [Bacteroidota bacterium]|jgi:uncharacterized protein (TIGR00730 family)|nr:TIGR00730 family Rossman fold protein [Bacteroidota bacterium]